MSELLPWLLDLQLFADDGGPAKKLNQLHREGAKKPGAKDRFSKVPI